MPSDFRWISSEEIIELNGKVVAASGENHAVISYDRLEGAVGRPMNLYEFGGEADVLALGVSYMFSVADAHPFEQGNKRTGFLTGRIFMNFHGYDLTQDYLSTAQKFIAVIDKQLSVQEFQTHLEDFLVEMD